MTPTYTFENRLRQQGFALIAGVDEAGRGPLAGPVVAAAVILPKGLRIKGLDDSKKLSAEKRAKFFEIIRDKAVAVSVGIADVHLINKVNILQATLYAMREAVLALDPSPDYLLIDGNKRIQSTIPQQTVVKGDSKSRSIAAASVIAKVVRDKIMFECHKQYPAYGFDAHKGYGTAFHIEMLKKIGPSPVHRNYWRSVMQEKLF